MEDGVFNRSRVSSIILYSILFWTTICFIGTWFVIIKYEIIFEGFIALVMTFFFAAIIWLIPFMVLILLFFYVTPTEERPPYVMFKDLVSKGVKRSST